MADYTFAASPLTRGALYGLDTFRGAAGGLLDVHVADVGSGWTRVYAGDGTTALALDGTGRLVPSSQVGLLYLKQDAPPQADYDVWLAAQDNVVAVGSLYDAKLLAVARYHGATSRAYVAGFTTSTHLSRPSYGIYLWSGGVLTPLVTPVLASLTQGQDYTCRFSVRGTALTLFLPDGGTLQATDSTLTAAGAAGICTEFCSSDGLAGYYARKFRLTYDDPATLLASASAGAGATPAPHAAPAGLPAPGLAYAWRVAVSPQAAPGTLRVGAVGADVYRPVASLAAGPWLPAPAVGLGVGLAPAPLAAPGTPRTPTVAFGSSLRPSPLAAAGAVAAWAPRGDAGPATGPLAAAGAPAAVALQSINNLQPSPLAAAGVLAGAAGGSAGVAAAPLAATPGLPAAAAAGSASRTPAPLAAPGMLPATAPLATISLSVVLAAPGTLPAAAVAGAATLGGVLAGQGTLAPVSPAYARSFTVSPLAAPAVLVSESTRVDVVAGGVLAAPGVLAGAASGTAAVVAGPLAAPGALPAARLQLEAAVSPAPLAGVATFLYGSLLTGGDFSTRVAPLAYSAGLGLPAAGLDWTIVPAPLAAPGALVFSGSGIGVTPAVSPLAAPGTLPTATATTSDAVPLGTATLRLRATAFAAIDAGAPFDGQAWQPLGPDEEGSDYPLVEPSDDIRHLIAHMALAYRAEDYRPPLRLAWVAGLGGFFLGDEGFPAPPATTPPPGLPAFSATHPCDLAIVDADGRVVFDSTALPGYAGEQYGPYLYAHRWAGPDSALYLTQRTKFPRPDLAFRVPDAIWPASARLCERVAEVGCRQLTSLDGLAGSPLLVPGYNVALPHSGPTVVGVARGSTITIDCVPGAGQGRYPGCSGEPAPLSALGAAAANAAGDVALSGDGCYHFRPLVSVDAGLARLVPGAIAMGNDCKPCCSCRDYVELAAAVAGLWEQLRALGADAEALRALLEADVARWDKLVDPAAVPLAARVVGRAHNFRYVDLAVQACYVGDACKSELGARLTLTVLGGTSALTFRPEPEGAFISNLCPTEEPTAIRHPVYNPPFGSSYILAHADRWSAAGGGGAAFLIDLLWGKVQPRTPATARIRLAFGGVDATVPTTLRVHAAFGDLPAPQVVDIPLVSA